MRTKAKPVIQIGEHNFISMDEAASRAGRTRTAIFNWIRNRVALPPGCQLEIWRQSGTQGPVYIREDSFAQLLQSIAIQTEFPQSDYRHHIVLRAHLIIQDQQEPARVLLMRHGLLGEYYDLVSDVVRCDETPRETVVRSALKQARFIIDRAWPQLKHVIYMPGYIHLFFALDPKQKWLSDPEDDDAEWHSVAALPRNTIPYVRVALNYRHGNILDGYSEWDIAEYDVRMV